MIKALQDSTPGVLLLRIIIAAVVVIGTYNPTGKSVYHWVTSHENPFDAWVILVVIIVAMLHIVLLIAAWKALGIIGTIITLILFGALSYLSLQEGWVSFADGATIQWLALILYSVFLGVGLAGAIIWRRATGQVTVDEADDQ